MASLGLDVGEWREPATTYTNFLIEPGKDERSSRRRPFFPLLPGRVLSIDVFPEFLL